MTKIILLGAAPIDGEMRYPSESPLTVTPTVAKDLRDVGLAIIDDLEAKPVVARKRAKRARKKPAADLRTIAQTEGVDIGPNAGKTELVEGIREHRANEN